MLSSVRDPGPSLSLYGGNNWRLVVAGRVGEDEEKDQEAAAEAAVITDSIESC